MPTIRAGEMTPRVSFNKVMWTWSVVDVFADTTADEVSVHVIVVRHRLAISAPMNRRLHSTKSRSLDDLEQHFPVFWSPDIMLGSCAKKVCRPFVLFFPHATRIGLEFNEQDAWSSCAPEKFRPHRNDVWEPFAIRTHWSPPLTAIVHRWQEVGNSVSVEVQQVNDLGLELFFRYA